MKIEQTPWDTVGAEDLRARQRAEVDSLIPDNVEPGRKPSAEDIAAFFMVWTDDGVPIGCGGLRDLGGGVGEVKRMYADPAYRGTGVAALVLDSLEGWARAAGWTHLRLETGPDLHAAIRFYTRSGFEPVENYGPYIGFEKSVCYEKSLLPVAR